MRRNWKKLMILALLIILCIGQTAVLWLGNVPSHNFFAKGQDKHHTVLLQPKYAWINMAKLAYNIDDAGSTYSFVLMEEIEDNLNNRTYKLEKINDIEYEELLDTEGIMYEYGAVLNLSNLTGKIENKDISFDHLFVSFIENINNKTYIYCIKGSSVQYRIVINANLTEHTRLFERLNQRDNEINFLQYQASGTSNYSQYIEHNIFYPLNGEDNPLVYNQIQFVPVIDEDKKEAELDGYVNTFFANPLLKEVKTKTSGNIVFNEGLKTTVRYTDKNIMEFKIASTNQSNKLTMAKKLDMVGAFIESCEGIPKEIKEGMYIEDMFEDVNYGETIFRFGYKYDGYPVILTNSVKKSLGINAFVEIAIKNNQIVRGKWLMYRPEVTDNGRTVFTEDIQSVMNKIYAKKQLDDQIENLQCGYIVKEIDKKVDFGWSMLCKGMWTIP